MTQTDLETLQNSLLFRAWDKDFSAQIFEKYGQVRNVEKGQPLLSSDIPECAVLLSGAAQILSASDVRPMILRFASKGDAVGLAGLFLPSPIPTVIRACGEKTTRIYVLNRTEVQHMMNKDRHGVFRDTLLTVLSKKIDFLNNRISSVTSGNAETRFALFLLSSLGPDGTLDPGMSMTALADTLNMGRASLYRAVTDLSAQGILIYENNIFTVPDPHKLHTYCFGNKEA